MEIDALIDPSSTLIETAWQLVPDTNIFGVRVRRRACREVIVHLK